MDEIGFIILTHDNPNQTLRLVSRLNSLYGFPPISLHHDFSKSYLPASQLTENVFLVKDYVVTHWGTYSLVEAKLKALALLFEKFSPKYYVTLSGADYPVKKASDVLETLNSLKSDVYIRSSLISYDCLDKAWKKQYYDRYCSLKLIFKRKNKNNRSVVSQLTFLRNPKITNYFTPFSPSLRCWGGEFWYTANDVAAKYLLDYVKNDKDGLVKHYKHTKIPDESIFQTIFKNSKILKCSNQNFRYIDWKEKLPHPKVLGVEDLTKIKESDSHFARKFDQSGSKEAINIIDAWLNC
ncbi:beta-1,6-N-acetylglucosaminyltransferase [Glaciecola sp. MF2-115]|uniref:beta-1,6-N-acetylglucosaminyltransferase n=1 Tax=Glaciecola sp. MF2-115 TaxID=3384827 RepID=UPI0039A137CA